MKDYDNGYDEGYNDRNQDGKTTKMPLLYQYPIVQSLIRSLQPSTAEENWVTMETALHLLRTMYLHVRLYIYPIMTIF